MEEFKGTEIKVGIFVLAGLTIAVWIIISLGKEARIFVDQYNLKASFSDVAGLREGAPVRLGGIDVGTVHSIEFPESLNVKKVIVTMKIGREFKSRIRQDSIATIETQGILGDKYISISFGSPDFKTLEHGDYIKTENPRSALEFVSKGSEIMDSTLKIFKKVDEILSGREGEEAKSSLSDTIKSIKRIVEEIENGKGLLHTVIYDRSKVESLGKCIENIETLTGELTYLMKGMREKESNLNQLLYGKRLNILIEDILKLTKSIDNLIRDIRKEDGLLHSLIYGKEEENIINNLTEASKDLRDFLEKISKGEGSLGALINDPTLYRDLKILLGKTERSKIIKSYIKKALEKGKKEEEER